LSVEPHLAIAAQQLALSWVKSRPGDPAAGLIPGLRPVQKSAGAWIFLG